MAFFRNILQSSTVAGVELVTDTEGIREIYVCILKKEKEVVKTVHTRTVYTVRELAELVKGMPVLLTVNGTIILHKKISQSSQHEKGGLARKVLPNASDEDFVIQQTTAANHSRYISLVRRSYADNLLSQLFHERITVVACYFGPFIARTILPLTGGSELKTPRFTILFRDGEVDEIQHNEESASHVSFARIGEENIEQSLLLSFAAAFSHFLPPGDSLSVSIPAVEASREEFRQKAIFQATGKGLLIFFLLLLMVNYFVFDSYWRKKSDMQNRFNMNQGLISKYEKLGTELQDKEKFLEKAGLLAASRSSYYADRLAKDITPGVSLTRMDINPVVKKESADSLLEFKNRTIVVNGRCRESIDLNTWIKVLKTKNWIRSVTILAYRHDMDQREGSFMISLDIK